ncbi:MAG TPA: hypothetical protein VGB19_12500 [Actinomycetota bacterium]
MGMQPPPSGDAEFNQNDWQEQDLEAQIREVRDERAADGDEERRSFWRRLFRKKR